MLWRRWAGEDARLRVGAERLADNQYLLRARFFVPQI